jgi:hypothetical protein
MLTIARRTMVRRRHLFHRRRRALRRRARPYDAALMMFAARLPARKYRRARRVLVVRAPAAGRVADSMPGGTAPAFWPTCCRAHARRRDDARAIVQRRAPDAAARMPVRYELAPQESGGVTSFESHTVRYFSRWMEMY